MKKGLYGSLVALLVNAGFAVAQEPLVPAAPEPTRDWILSGPGDPAIFATVQDRYQHRVWGGAEYLLWWVKDSRLPDPLVTSGDPNSNNPGALNAGGTPLFGGNHGLDAFSGVRITLGIWLDADATIGIEGSGFGLPRQSRTFRVASDANGSPVLAFRYLDAFPPDQFGQEDAFQASIPGQFTGNLAVHTSTSLWGIQANAIVPLWNTDIARIQGLAGFRYINLTDVLDLAWLNQTLPGSTVPFLGNNFGAPSAVTSLDSFRTRNQFYGGQVGVRVEYILGNAFVGFGGKVALGGNHEVVQIAGASSLIQPGAATSTVNLGQFAGPSNIGRFNKNQFVVVPEVNLKLGYDITRNVRAFVGYDFMYMSNVVRANNQLDLLVDTRANPVNGGFVAPTPATTFPRLPFSRTDFWAQGVNFGLEFVY